MQFWRSGDAAEANKSRQFEPVFLEDWGKKRETWDVSIREDDTDHVPYTIQTRPRMVLDMPFDLTTDRRIPTVIWDAVDEAGLPYEIIGAPPAAVRSRGRKRPTANERKTRSKKK